LRRPALQVEVGRNRRTKALPTAHITRSVAKRCKAELAEQRAPPVMAKPNASAVMTLQAAKSGKGRGEAHAQAAAASTAAGSGSSASSTGVSSAELCPISLVAAQAPSTILGKQFRALAPGRTPSFR
jgi:hypothetical protein